MSSVREFLTDDASKLADGRLRFHVKVSANALAMVARELALGPSQVAEHARRLDSLGVQDEAGLADAIRTGALDARLESVYAVVRETVADKLAVANPTYVEA